MTPTRLSLLWIVTVVTISAAGNAVSSPAPQDVDKILEKADKILEEAKASYEEARAKSSVSAFVDAGFKLEEARIKYLVIQEIGLNGGKEGSAIP